MPTFFKDELNADIIQFTPRIDPVIGRSNSPSNGGMWYDTTPRFSTYCGFCDAWICSEDLNRWDRRLHAAIKRKLERGYKGVSNYEEIVNQNGEINEREKSGNIISTSGN